MTAQGSRRKQQAAPSDSPAGGTPQVAQPLLEVDGLAVSFGVRQRASRPVAENRPGIGSSAVKALDGISLSISRGECVGLVGESGSGKSVTALAVMGLLSVPPARIDAGRIMFRHPEEGGKPIDLLELPRGRWRNIRGKHIAMIFQDPLAALNPYLRVSDQMIEALKAHRRISWNDAYAEAVRKLEEVGIPDADRRIEGYPHQFSGGMCQRILIAAALLHDPALLIADEPTTALDVTIQAQILDLLGDLRKRRGMAVLLITHDLGVVAEQTQRVLVIYAGRIVESAMTDDIFRRPAHPYTVALRRSIPTLSTAGEGRITPIPGRPPAGSPAAEACAFAPRCRRVEERCRCERPPLREVRCGHLAACWFPENISQEK
jgi:oligopeptide/dipeptide ABC transporter ATP-binding protein